MSKEVKEVKNVNANEETVNTVAENAPVEETTEDTTTEEKKKQLAVELDKKLHAFPRKLTIGDLILYRTLEVETWLNTQRTPSHTVNDALKIIDSAINGRSCGVITLGHNTDDDSIVTVNGSSRIDDFIRFYYNKIGKKESQYKDLPTDTQKKFLSHQLSIDWLEGDEKSLTVDFINLNNNTALTGGQKAYGNLIGSSAIDIVNALNKHEVFESFLSKRQIVKQEQNNILFLILANIFDCYSSKIDKVTGSLATKDCNSIDVDKLQYIFDRIVESEVEINKYKLIHLAHLLYVGECCKSKSLRKAFNIEDITNADLAVFIAVNYKKEGTNSSDMNQDRIKKMSAKMYNQLADRTATDTNVETEPTLSANDFAV